MNLHSDQGYAHTDVKWGGNSSRVKLCVITSSSVFNIVNHRLTGRSWKNSHNDSKAGKITLGGKTEAQTQHLINLT